MLAIDLPKAKDRTDKRKSQNQEMTPQLQLGGIVETGDAHHTHGQTEERKRGGKVVITTVACLFDVVELIHVAQQCVHLRLKRAVANAEEEGDAEH